MNKFLSDNSSLEVKFNIEICLTHTLGFCFRPGFKAHFPDQTQIENLRIVCDLNSFVSIRMQVIAREVRALTAEINVFGLDTLVNLAGLDHIESSYSARFTAASFTDCLLERNIPFLRDVFSQFCIFAREIHWTVETIKSARRS